MVSFLNMFRKTKAPAAEARSVPENGSWFFSVLADFLRSDAGEIVTPETAMQISVVNCCVRVLSETVATLPCHVFRMNPDGTRRRLLYPNLRPITSGMVNGTTSWRDFTETAMTHLLLRGNAYAYIVRDDDGEVAGLVPLMADRVTVRVEDTGNLLYLYRGRNQEERRFRQHELFHVRNMSQDGIVGLSQIALAREPLGIARAQDRYAAKYFSNSARPAGILTTDAPLKEDAARQNRDMWHRMHGGAENSGKVAVLCNGLKWQPLAMSNEDSQFLESRKFSTEEVCRIFRVPQHLAGILDHATFSNIESQQISFLSHTVMPWLSRWEAAIQRDLITDENEFVEFRTEELLRGDIASRYAAYAVGIQNGFLCPNDVRRRENLDPINGGDTFRAPLNTEPIGESKPAAKDSSRSNGQAHRANGHSEVLSWRS